ncbi:hypothetical protein L9F63_006126 [Diploptera punctata]|uniref:G-patch domain-containing protein n=1 Tax=Diploptera punctata TaxID=6984 RepID=A0AAD8E5H7_DIPPU|nr:hypothetical protein L9F63_006126 [Diploptera punctata]
MHPNWKGLATVNFPWKQFLREGSSSEEKNYKLNTVIHSNLTGEEAKRIYEEVVSSNPSQHKVVSEQPKKSKKSLVHNVTSYSKEKWINTLMSGAQRNDVACISSLLVKDLDINATDQYGWTALMSAACSGAVDAVKLLLEHGADVHVKDKCGNTCLSLARIHKHDNVVNLILKPPQSSSSKETEAKTENFYCEVCKQQFSDTTRARHSTSMVHLLCLGPPLTVPTVYGIPANNKGYQILLKGGWDREKGLGPSGSGNKFPLKTVLKRDREGFGKCKRKAQVTHTLGREQTVRTISRRARAGALNKEQRKERALRRHGLLENPQKSLEYLEQLEKLGEDITRDQQEVVAIDRRRNQNREALRALRHQKGNTWITLGSLLVKVPVDKATQLLQRDQVQLDTQINTLRSNLKVKVNKLRDMEYQSPVPGLMLNPMTTSELSAVGQALGRHA